jgi:DNA-binding winged helix-turn-helix (wHTH) protein
MDGSSFLLVYRPGVGTSAHPIDRPSVLVGRSDEAEVRLSSPYVSKRHALVETDDGGMFVRDLGSKNGTFLRGCRLTERTGLRHQDELVIGDFVLTFWCADEDDYPTRTQETPLLRIRADRAAHELEINGVAAPVRWSSQEFALVATLADARGSVVSHGQIGASIWGVHDGARAAMPAYSPNMVHRVVRRVREKLANADSPVSIVNVPAVGYRMIAVSPVTAEEAHVG